MAANVESMVSVRATPWHGLGVVVQDYLTAAEAIQHASMDWEVRVAAVPSLQVTTPEGIMASLPEGKFTYRVDTGAGLGYVGGRYTPIQNREQFRFMDAVVGSGQAIYETAGVLDGGRVTWILARFSQFEVVPEDIVKTYLLLSSSHDGSRGLTGRLTNVRVVCQNTLGAATRGTGASFAVRHTAGFMGRVHDAQQVLGFVNSAATETQEAFQAMAATPVREEQVAALFDKLWPALPHEQAVLQKRRDTWSRHRDSVTSLYAKAGDYTAWGLYNATTEHADWFQRVEVSAEDRFKRNVVVDNPVKETALEYCLSLVK